VLLRENKAIQHQITNYNQHWPLPENPVNEFFHNVEFID